MSTISFKKKRAEGRTENEKDGEKNGATEINSQMLETLKAYKQIVQWALDRDIKRFMKMSEMMKNGSDDDDGLQNGAEKY